MTSKEKEDFQKLFSSMPEWLQEAFSEDIYVYKVFYLARINKMSRDQFLEKLCRVLFERSKALENVWHEHVKVCTPSYKIAYGLSESREKSKNECNCL